MLDDRDYMRATPSSWGRWRWSATVVLLATLVAAFILQNIAYKIYSQPRIDEYFALSLAGLKQGHVWQLLTFQFMHGGFVHLLFNSLAIFFFGRPVEAMIGTNRFLKLYFASGLAGGLFQMLFALLVPHFNAQVVGASAGASGLVAAFAVLKWDERFTLLIYFIPVNMRGRTLLWVSVGLAVFGIVAMSTDVAHAAHLGGIFIGWFYIRRMQRGEWFSGSRIIQPAARPLRKFAGVPSKKTEFWKSNSAHSQDLPSTDFLSKEVDPILDKISAHGIHSLTEREREILEAARKKMTG